MDEHGPSPATVIAAAARDVRTARREDLPRRLNNLALSIESELGNPEALRIIAGDLAPIAVELGCGTMIGASSIGERIAGAFIATHGEDLSIAQGAALGSVLVVDGVLSTGVQMQRAISKAREAGAQKVAGVVVAADRDALRLCNADPRTRVIALAEF